MAIWLLLVVLVQHRLIGLLVTPVSVIQFTSLAILLVWTNVVWLQAIHIVVVMLLPPDQQSCPNIAPSVGVPVSVAILYTTKNDFSEVAARSCVSQSHPHFHVFLLDDSSEAVHQSEVDSFHAKHPSLTTVVRRQSKAGFKAGNLNHALREISSDWQFFAICDADGVLPSDFLNKTLAHFSTDEIGFVQARQRAVLPPSHTRFAADMVVAGEIYWDRILPAAQRTGFVMFHGHGGTIRTSAWQAVGGFPEVVSEDLEFTTRIRRLGYVGVVANDVICDEDFPRDYSSFCKRHLTYVRGTCEHIRRDMVHFLWSVHVPWYEKLDRLLASSTVISGPMFAVMLFNWLLLLPFACSSGTDLATPKQWNQLSTVFLAGGGAPFTECIWMPALHLITLLAVVLQSLPAVIHLRKEPKRLAHLVIQCSSVYMGTLGRQTWHALVVCFTGRNFFPVTGATVTPSRTGENDVDGSHLERPTLIDSVTMLLLLIFGATSGNLLMVTPLCVAIGFGLVASRIGWEHHVLRNLRWLPFSLSVIILGGWWIDLLKFGH